MRFGEALVETHTAARSPMNLVAEENYWILGVNLAQLEEWPEAERVLREGLTFAELGTYTLAALGYGLARSGRRTEAEAVLSGLEARARTEYISPVAFVTTVTAVLRSPGFGPPCTCRGAPERPARSSPRTP